MQVTNWWGIAAATVALAFFLSVYSSYSLWVGRKFRKEGAATPSTGLGELGGRRWWGRRFEILPFVVMLLYLGMVFAFINHRLTEILAYVWFGSAFTVAVISWLIPFYAKTKEKLGKREEKKQTERQAASPYTPVDSGRGFLWKLFLRVLHGNERSPL